MTMLTFVVGTRPEAIKVAPVVTACQAIGLPTTVIHTGQHTDLLLGTGLTPDISLPHRPIGGPETWYDWGGDTRTALRPHLRGLVVVQGDTMSAYAGCLTCFHEEHPLYHIEAGIRSGDAENPFPEEGFRICIDETATAGACATEQNFMNVVATKHPDRWRNGNSFTITGNPGIDALYAIQKPIAVEDRLPTVLVTLHRRESWGAPLAAMGETVRTLAVTHPDLCFAWPAHPSPAVKAALPHDPPGNLRIWSAVPHQELVTILASCTAVITDSGGIQEEAAALGIPCVVCREVTDRPESVATNQAVVVGRDPERIIQGFEQALTTLSREPSHVFGDGQAAPRIAAHLASLLD